MNIYQQKKLRHEQVKKPFRKNGMNVGMASTSIGRKEVSFMYVHHTINSARTITKLMYKTAY